MKKIFIFIFCLFVFNSGAIAKETTFNKELFDKAQSDGKIVIVSSWVKYCTSCASQMKVLDKAKNDFKNIEYFKFDVRNKEIANLRRNVGMVFQNPQLLNDRSVFENISIPLHIQGLGLKYIKNQVNEVLSKLGIEDKKNHFPNHNDSLYFSELDV